MQKTNSGLALLPHATLLLGVELQKHWAELQVDNEGSRSRLPKTMLAKTDRAAVPSSLCGSDPVDAAKVVTRSERDEA